MKIKVYYVDAFTSKIFGGNPAGVVISHKELADSWMQKTARELNLSETVFVTPDLKNPRVFHTRFFTPITEVDLCGHAALGAFHVLAKEGYLQKKQDRFHVKQKTITEEFDIEIINKGERLEILMAQSTPRVMDQIIDLDRLSTIMGVHKNEIGITNHKNLKEPLKPTIAYTGLKDLIVPIKSLKTLEEITIDEEKLKKYSKELGVVGIHAFTLETLRGNTAHCRNFAPLVGISEEAATGTASGALSYYLLVNKHGDPKDHKALVHTFEQGDCMGRPSEIRCYITKDNGKYGIKVGGEARIFIKGEILSGDKPLKESSNTLRKEG